MCDLIGIILQDLYQQGGYPWFDGIKSMSLSRSQENSRCDIHDGSEVPENNKSNKSRVSRLQKAFQDTLTEIHLSSF